MKKSRQPTGVSAEIFKAEIIKGVQRVLAAGLQVGATPSSHLTWLIHFGQRDLGAPGAIGDAAAEVTAFVIEQNRNQFRRGRDSRVLSVFDPNESVVESALTIHAPPEVRRAQQIVRECLEGLRTRGRYDFPADLRIRWSLVWARPRGTVRLDVIGDGVVQFVNAVRDLLVTHGKQLRSCQQCQGLFFAPRPKSIYCGRQCQDRATSARYRERKATKQRERYVRRTRARLSPTTKIATRPRKPRQSE